MHMANKLRQDSKASADVMLSILKQLQKLNESVEKVASMLER